MKQKTPMEKQIRALISSVIDSAKEPMITPSSIASQAQEKLGGAVEFVRLQGIGAVLKERFEPPATLQQHVHCPRIGLS
jgi:hypothetical protein